MEQQFSSLEEMINYMYTSKGKEDTKIKTVNTLNQLDKVYKESKEEYKERKMFILIQILKYYLVTIDEYEIAYELYRKELDEQYDNYLKENNKLDKYFLFATEIDLICAMKIDIISKEIKLMSLLIDIEKFSIPEDHKIENLHFYFAKEPIEAYGYFIKYLIEKKELTENESIVMLFSYLKTCLENFSGYTEIFYCYILKDIKSIIRENSYSEFCYNTLNFYNALFAFFSKENLKNEIDIKEHFNEDNIKLKEEFEKHKDIYNEYDETTIHNGFKEFFNSITENEINTYLDTINDIIKGYYERFQEYTDQDILMKLIQLKNQDLPDYKKHLLDQHICQDIEYEIETQFEKKNYKSIVDLYNSISDDYSGKDNLFNQCYFEIAYSFNEIGNKEYAKKLYQDAVNRGENSSAVYNNLGVIYDNEGDKQRALSFFIKAHELDPKDEIAKKNKDNTEKAIKESKKKEQQLKTTYFNKLQKYHKSILFTIYRYSDEVTDEVLQEIIKQEKYALKKNINFLLDNEMLQQTSNGSYIINSIIQKWIREYVNPTLERQIVKVDNSKLYRPIFYHESEINLYRVLIELFPQHFIFPNMSLKTIFEIDKLREMLEQDVLSYLFKAHADFVIVNTATYFPVLAFEKDSEYNDKEPSKTNNEYKNQIFKNGGIPLIRLRYNSGMDYEKLKQEVKDATKNLILEIESGNGNSEFDLLKEIDKKRFGITNTSVDLKIIQKEWDTIVGSGIAIKSKVIDLEDRNLIIDISIDLKSIIEMGKENINKKILEKFSFIDDIKYNWY